MPLVWREQDAHGNPLRQKDLYPRFLVAVNDAFNQLPDTWYVTYGFRSNIFQAQLHSAYVNGKGPKAAPAGMSAHNYGCAIDVVLDADPDTPGLQPSWNEKLAGWVRYYKMFLTHPTLRDGRFFRDGGHIEWRDWKLVKAQSDQRSA